MIRNTQGWKNLGLFGTHEQKYRNGNLGLGELGNDGLDLGGLGLRRRAGSWRPKLGVGHDSRSGKGWQQRSGSVAGGREGIRRGEGGGKRKKTRQVKGEQNTMRNGFFGYPPTMQNHCERRERFP